MMTIGDVLTVVAFLAGLGVTAWALMVSCGLLFPGRVERARDAARSRPFGNIGIGLLTLLPGLIGALMLRAPMPGVKLVGWTLILAVLGIGAIGAAGLGHLAGKSLARMSPGIDEYPAFVRGCAFLVTASLMPLLGWFAFGPLALLSGLGAGVRSLLVPERTQVVA